MGQEMPVLSLWRDTRNALEHRARLAVPARQMQPSWSLYVLAADAPMGAPHGYCAVAVVCGSSSGRLAMRIGVDRTMCGVMVIRSSSESFSPSLSVP